MDERGRSALVGFIRASHDPRRFWLECQAYLDGTKGPGGRAVPPAKLGEALHAIAFADPPVAMGERVLAGYVRRVMTDEAPPANGGRRPRRSRDDEDPDSFTAAGRELKKGQGTRV